MTLTCSHCGAPLQAEPDQTLVTCGYCKTVTRIGKTRRRSRTESRPQAAPPTRIAGLVLAGVAVTAAVAAFVAYAQTRTGAPSTERALEPAPPARAPVVAEPAPAREPPPPTDPTATMPQTVMPKQPPTPAASGKPRKPEPVFTGPISTKKEAEAILRPELLACMKQHGVHYLITRLGNEPRGANVPPLGLTGTSVVDYKPTPSFASTPLGRCVARAGSGVRAPAYGGNYIYFGLRNDSIPDPLADAPARLDTAAAKQALAALDDEARDCTTRSPAGSRPGESVSVMVYFEGATGQVSRVEPYYVDIRSAYGRCLTAVYRKARVGTFRDIDQHVVHVLEP